MAKTISYEVEADEAKRLEAAVKELITQMQETNQRMDERQVEIDRLKAETRIMLKQISELRAAL